MKGKGAASLYEVLKSASRPGGDPAAAAAAPAAPPVAEGPTQTLQERLAAYKAQKLAEATSPPAAPEAPAEAPATAVAEMTPPPAPRVVAPPPPPLRPMLVSPPTLVLPTPAPVLETPAAGPGERTARLTYNAVAFAALVVVGLLFVAYAVGVQSGRRRAAVEEVAAAPAPPPRPQPSPRDVAPPPPPPPPPAKVYTVWLAEWRYKENSERVKADDAVRQLKAALDRANLKGVEVMKVQRGAEPRLAMYIDRLKAADSAETRARLAAFQKFKFGTQLPFAQAAIVELPK